MSQPREPSTIARSRWVAPPPTLEERQRVQAEIEQIRRRIARESAIAVDLAGSAGLIPYWRRADAA